MPKALFSNRSLIVGGIIIAVAALALFVKWRDAVSVPDPAKLALAECLTEKGVVMYGAYWCPHCQNQKEMFGDAWEKVRSVECAVPGNPRAQTQECRDAGIEGYPTWVFPDGSRISGEMPLRKLAEKSGCPFE